MAARNCSYKIIVGVKRWLDVT